MLLYCSGYHIYCRGCNLLQGMQTTAGDANNYPSGYHTNTGYMAFELSHISYHMAPEHAMLLQGTPRCSRVLHCSIGCYSTAADTTSTAGDAIYCRGCKQSTAGYMIISHIIPYGKHLLQGRGCITLYCSGYHSRVYAMQSTGDARQLPQRIPH